MPTAAPRIYADFNGLVRGPVDGRVSVVLDTFGSARDLSNAGIVLEEGLALVAYDESDAIEDLEIHGTARYDRFRRGWVVESDERGVMHVPAVDRSRIDPGFHCVRCAHALDGLDAFLRAGACPQCGTPVQACVAAPDPTPEYQQATRMTTTLYYSRSTASLVVHWLLIELDIPHALRELDFDRRDQKSEDYLKLNPAGVVPTLVMDGQVVTETAAILMHLADTHPRAELAPAVATTQRAQYYRWMLFCANTLMPAYRAWFYADEIAGPENAEASRLHARLKLERAWQQVADHLEAHGPYLLGVQRCAADFLLTMLMRWSRNMPRPTDSWPVLHAHAQRMKALPSFKEVYAREGLTDWT